MKTKLTWLAGCLCLAVALWLGFGVPGDGRSKESPMALNGRVTKPYPRDHDPRMEGRANNPREEFDAARKRGMTEQEVRWVVDDLMSLGIDSDEISLDNAEGYYRVGMKRQVWLLETMASGFGLSKNQEKEVEAKIRALGERDLAEFSQYIEGIKTFEADGKAYRIVNGSKVRRLTDAYEWLRGDDYAPWNLAELDEGQKDMVRFKDEDGRWAWILGGSRTLDFGTDEHYQGSGDAFMADPMIMNGAGRIFPLSMGQVDRIIDSKARQGVTASNGKGKVGSLELVKILTVAQLRTLLLYEPGLGRKLLEEMER